jgi:hypothetical protein
MRQFEVIGTPEDLDGARDLASRGKYQFQWWACSLVNAQPYQGKKKGADGGIDGLIFFQDDKGAAKKIVVSLKGGEHVSVAMVRDLAHVVAREKAEIGLFVTLAEPSKPMETEAVEEGFYTSPAPAPNSRASRSSPSRDCSMAASARVIPTLRRAATPSRRRAANRARPIKPACFKGIPIFRVQFVVRQAHHERDREVTVRPEPVEG